MIGETFDTARAEIERVGKERPLLATRAGKAIKIVENHLQNPRAGLIRASYRGGRWAFYVAGSRSEPYRVDPHNRYACTCPDYERRQAACKHGIAVWSLIRLAHLLIPGAEVIELHARAANTTPQKESA